MTPNNINPVQWQQSVGYARAVCARVYRDGGQPQDALAAFGIDAQSAPAEWATVVDRIATRLSKASGRMAA